MPDDTIRIDKQNRRDSDDIREIYRRGSGDPLEFRCMRARTNRPFRARCVPPGVHARRAPLSARRGARRGER